jgi:hypothetical protein
MEPPVDSEDPRLRERRFGRIRRVKRLLRPLPRRSNIRRYPVLKWFSGTALRRMYLWSFRRPEVIPALYAGWVIALVPLYGLQLILAFLAALVLRANLVVLAGLQLVSNPLTVLPLWYLNYLVGNVFLNLFFGHSPVRYGKLFEEAKEKGHNFYETLRFLVQETRADGVNLILDLFGRLFGGTFLGGILLGLLAGFVSSVVYRLLLRRATGPDRLPRVPRPRAGVSGKDAP